MGSSSPPPTGVSAAAGPMICPQRLPPESDGPHPMRRRRSHAVAFVLIVWLSGVGGAISLISVEQETEIGKQALAQVRKQVPEVRDREVVNYVRALGRRLVPYAKGPKYSYSFWVADYRELNAFALPGGPVWLQMMTRAGWDPRGMVELFEILRREGKRDPGAVEVFFSSHPSPQDRITELRAEVARHPGGRRDSQEFKDIKARLHRLPPPKVMPRTQ